MCARRNVSLTISCLGLAILTTNVTAHAQQNPQRIALKSGENTVLREYFYILNCQSILIGNPVLDILEGAQELDITLKPEMVLPRGQSCAKPVPGGNVIATAKDVDVPKEVKLTIRLTFHTKQGDRQAANTYIVSLFPSRSCALQVPGTSERRTGRVTGLVSEEQASVATRRVEAQTGAQISPAYQSLQRVTVEDGSFKTMAAVPGELTIQVGDLVELNSRYRDPGLACHFIPWTVNRLVGHAQ